MKVKMQQPYKDAIIKGALKGFSSVVSGRAGESAGVLVDGIIDDYYKNSRGNDVNLDNTSSDSRSRAEALSKVVEELVSKALNALIDRLLSIDSKVDHVKKRKDMEKEFYRKSQNLGMHMGV